ncbi:MAG: sigma 54-interacting transcriptional regulator [Candidatus Eisenbacteria bacterium]
MRFREPFRLRRNLAEIGELLGLPPPLPPHDLSRDLGSIYYSSSRYKDAIEEFRRALEGTNGPAAAERESVCEKLAWCCFWIGDHKEAAALLRAAGERPGTLVLEGRIALERGDLESARIEGESALAAAARDDCREWIGPARSLLGVVAQREGRSVEAREHFDEAMLSYRIAGDAEGECRTAIHLGTLAKSECSWGEAFRHLDRARRRAEDAGFLYLYGSASLNRGNLGYRLGLLEEAEAAVREARRVFSEIGYELGSARALIALARLALDRGRSGELRGFIGAAEAICENGRFPREKILIEELLAADEERRGFPERAEERLRGALALAGSVAAGGDAAVTISLELADLLLCRGSVEEAERLAIGLSGALAAVGDPSLEGRQRRILAEASLARGDWREARGEIVDAIRFFERIGYRRDLARSFVVAGRIESGRGGPGSEERALTHFLGAKRILEELGESTESALVSVDIARCWIEMGARGEARSALARAKEALDRAKTPARDAEIRALIGRLDPVSPPSDSPFGKIITGDAATLETLRVAERVSRYPVTVLIEGETGTGKQLLARAIHEASPRAGKPFVTVNCASLPEQILESELFGYMKGAFTGAVEDRKGLFEEADGGTILLDEIGKAGPHVQRSLLHVLDEGVIRPIGSTRRRPVDVRVICATSNLSLRRDIREDRFLKDLFYRINDITLGLPPLRDRRGDVALLGRRFLDRFREELGRPSVRFSPAVERLFEKYSWPGNVRELEKAILRAVLLAPGDLLEIEHLPADLVFEEGPERPRHPGAAAAGLREEVEALERRRLADVLDRLKWNRSRAARELGLSLRGLRNKIRRYGLEKRR